MSRYTQDAPCSVVTHGDVRDSPRTALHGTATIQEASDLQVGGVGGAAGENHNKQRSTNTHTHNP